MTNQCVWKSRPAPSGVLAQYLINTLLEPTAATKATATTATINTQRAAHKEEMATNTRVDDATRRNELQIAQAQVRATFI